MHPHPTPCTSPEGPWCPWRGLTAPSFQGQGCSEPFSAKRRSALIPDQSHHLPPSGKAGVTSCPHQPPLQGKDFGLSECLATSCSAWRRFPSPYLLPGSGACCQTGALLPAPKISSESSPGFYLLQHPKSAHRALQASPCSTLTLTRAPHLCPHEQMLHPWGHSWAVLCQMCKSTPLPLLLLRGCGLAALGWGREGGGGK